MSIDWFTVAAQAINLLVLLWLMKRFLYKPILKAIDEREKRIEEELANAKKDTMAAQVQKEKNDRKSEQLNRESAGILKKAQEEAQAEKQRLLEEARESADMFRKKRKDALEREETALTKEVRSRLQDEVLDLTRRVLIDLAGVSLEEQIVLAFTQGLRDLDQSQKKDLKNALNGGTETITLRTAFEISPQLRTNTDKAIKEILGIQSSVKFDNSSNLISGIELTVQGQKIAWSIRDYLSSMAEKFEVLPKEQVQ